MVEMSESIAELAAALSVAQGTIQPAIKDATNPAFRSKYADLGAVWEVCRPVLQEHGLSVVQLPVDAGDGRIGLTTILLHKSGQWIRSTASTRITKDDPQGVGSGLTYLRRYALSACLGVVADDDDDGNAASSPQRNQGRQPAQQERTPQAAATAKSAAAEPAPVSEKQREYIKRLMGDLAWDQDHLIDFAAQMQIDIKAMNADSASRLINGLKSTLNGR